jgi:uncharacterized protein DUF1302
MRTWAGWLALGLVLWAGSPSQAYFLDKGRNFDVRLRAYAQLGIMTESSDREGCPGDGGKPGNPGICPPKYSAGDLAQERNFYNPEFDAKLTDYTNWVGDVPGLSFFKPDEFKFRFAWWGFYDGIYDYVGGPWNEHRQQLKARFSESDDPRNESFVFNDQNKNPRHIYASRNRINEMYLDYTKGRVFVRAGRQAISWGEADTIALLDVQNPFDLTLGAPGFFQDVDEARIPLWTLRSTVKLIDNWKWLSSFFADAYVVPGVIDTTVPIDPITGGVSPFGPDVPDPQLIAGGQTIPRAGKSAVPVHVVSVSRLPENNWGNTRWGARLTGVLFRDYTVQGWFFRTFNQAPAPVLTSPGAAQQVIDGTLKTTQIDDRGFRTPICNDVNPATGLGKTPSGRSCSRAAAPAVTVLERRLESVVGVASTWYSQFLNGIVRTEAEYFIDEPAFIPLVNLNARAQLPTALQGDGVAPIHNSLAKADYVRWVLGYDRFFFFRPLNPSNSFVLSMAYNSSFNLSEKGGKDYRNPQAKPGKSQVETGEIPGLTIANGRPFCQGKSSKNVAFCIKTVPRNFVDAYQYEGFLQTALQTDYLHGKLSPRVVVITDVSGIFAFSASATYRITDSFLFSGTYLAIAGSRKASIGTFRAHDMMQLRLTYQLN